MKDAVLFASALTIACAGHALAAFLTSTPWEQADANALHAFKRTDVVQLLDNVTDFGNLHPCACVKPADIGEFTWDDLAGDGSEELVLTRDVNGRQFFNALDIFQRDASGKVTYQELDGWAIRDLHKVIRDLNGDGQDELVIPTVLFQYNTAGTFTWPVVYRLKKGKYVVASRDFPRFYDNQVLPALEKQMRDYQSKPGRGNQDTAAVLILEKDKILRMLGRNPTAGLQQAYQWMNTDDPFLLLAAAATFKDIGGHEAEAHTAAASYRRAFCERHPGMVMCRNLPQH
jgi:hypothetical protein